MIPEIALQHWYQYLLHAHRGRRLRSQLVAHGGDLTVIDVPWHLDRFRG